MLVYLCIVDGVQYKMCVWMSVCINVYIDVCVSISICMCTGLYLCVYKMYKGVCVYFVNIQGMLLYKPHASAFSFQYVLFTL